MALAALDAGSRRPWKLLEDLQRSDFASATSKRVFTCLQVIALDQGELSSEDSRIWRLRRGLEFPARQRRLTGDQVAKLIGHITWSCLLRRPALSPINAGYRFARTFGPRSGLVWPAVAQEFRWIASLLPLRNCNLTSPWSPWVCATDASGGARGGYGVTRRWCDPEDVAAVGRCAERWRFSAEEFVSARRSVLVDCERKAHKALWLGSEDVPKREIVLTCIPRLRVARKRCFQSMSLDCVAFENISSTILQPMSS